MKGIVVDGREALVPLLVEAQTGEFELIDFAIDTGFTGLMTLPAAEITKLGLPYVMNEYATLADGSIVECRVFQSRIGWHNRLRVVDITETPDMRLIGMRLLRGSLVTIQVEQGGDVEITPLSDQELPLTTDH